MLFKTAILFPVFFRAWKKGQNLFWPFILQILLKRFDEDTATVVRGHYMEIDLNYIIHTFRTMTMGSILLILAGNNPTICLIPEVPGPIKDIADDWRIGPGVPSLWGARVFWIMRTVPL